jgi:hypothetical protein
MKNHNFPIVLYGCKNEGDHLEEDVNINGRIIFKVILRK